MHTMPQIPETPKQAATRRTPLDRALDQELFKALSDATRLRLLSCLASCRRKCTVGEMAECCSVDYSVVARHLGLLHRTGLLDAERVGREVWYSVRATEMADRFSQLASLFESLTPLSADEEMGLSGGCSDPNDPNARCAC